MATPNLIKLAPTLSAEERYKLVVPDMHRELMGEKPLISESERQAITHFENRAIWEEYTQKLNMMRWALALWPKDIEAEKLRVIAFSLMLNHALSGALWRADEPMPKAKREERFATLREYVALIEEQSVDFYAHREAFAVIQRELYGVPVLNAKWMADITEDYRAVDEIIERYNETIRKICQNEVIRKRIKPIVDDTESYLVKKPIPDAELVERIVEDIRHIAASETRMLER
jgi:hypothetical protein